jgi:hypothetical protein
MPQTGEIAGLPFLQIARPVTPPYTSSRSAGLVGYFRCLPSWSWRFAYSSLVPARLLNLLEICSVVHSLLKNHILVRYTTFIRQDRIRVTSVRIWEDEPHSREYGKTNHIQDSCSRGLFPTPHDYPSRICAYVMLNVYDHENNVSRMWHNARIVVITIFNADEHSVANTKVLKFYFNAISSKSFTSF